MTDIPAQTHHATDERRYTPQELALLWNCSTDVIYDLLNRGRLVGFKIGSSWRIRHSEVLAYETDPRNRGAPATAQPTPAPAPGKAKTQYRVV